MTERHFIRQWTDGHEPAAEGNLARLRQIIGTAYGEAVDETSASNNTPAQTLLAGLAASVVTAVLFVSTVLVTTSGASLA